MSPCRGNGGCDRVCEIGVRPIGTTYSGKSRCGSIHLFHPSNAVVVDSRNPSKFVIPPLPRDRLVRWLHLLLLQRSNPAHSLGCQPSLQLR